jgi:predicted RNase H-like HicB family nuclease
MQDLVVYERAPSNWAAYVPDLPGCIAAGDSREEVKSLMGEAILLYCNALRQQNEPLPEPQAWTDLVEV